MRDRNHLLCLSLPLEKAISVQKLLPWLHRLSQSYNCAATSFIYSNTNIQKYNKPRLLDISAVRNNFSLAAESPPRSHVAGVRSSNLMFQQVDCKSFLILLYSLCFKKKKSLSLKCLLEVKKKFTCFLSTGKHALYCTMHGEEKFRKLLGVKCQLSLAFPLLL